MDRRNALAVVVAIAVASAAVGWFAGQRIKSPAELAAEAEPPEASLITVPVELRTISSNVITRGDINYSEATELSVQGSESGSTIITRLPKAAGDELAEGDVAIEVAGRPVFVLQGDLPTFRSFTPGLEGPDVRQLEDSLARLGFDPGPRDGVYTAATEDAVSDLYRAAGYTPDEPSREELESLSAARARVQQANQSLNLARSQLSEASSGLSQSELLGYDQSILHARGALSELEAQVNAETVELVAAEAASAQASAQANEAVVSARARLDAGRSGTDPDTGGPITDARLAELQANLSEAEEQAATAFAEWTADRAALDEAQGPYQTQLEGARLDLQIAEAQKSEALGGFDSSDLQQSVTAAQAEVTDANESLSVLDAEIGVTFPASEIIFLPSMPREVQRVTVAVGETPSGAVMTVTGAGITINSAVSADDRRLLEVGQTARIIDDDLGIDVGATLTFIADDAGTDGLPAERYRIRFTPDVELPEDAYLANVRVVIPVESTGGDVLAVPLAAVSAAADGTARVEVERSAGETELVDVVTGLSSGGYVAVEPIDGELSAGDRVVVGVDQAEQADDGDTVNATGDGGADDEPTADDGDSGG